MIMVLASCMHGYMVPRNIMRHACIHLQATYNAEDVFQPPLSNTTLKS